MTIKTYTTDEVAALAHCHVKTVQRWIREQRLPACKIGRRWLVVDGDLQQFFALGLQALEPAGPPSAEPQAQDRARRVYFR